MFSGNGNGRNGVPADPPRAVRGLRGPDPLVLDPLVLDPLVLDPLVLDPLVLPDVLLLLKMGEPNFPSPSVELGTLSCTLKLKSTPTDSKKSSSTVIRRTSTVTCRSCSRLNCVKRSRISSWTRCVWRMTRLKVDSSGCMVPGPPVSSHDSGSMVVIIKCLMESKSGCAIALAGWAERRLAWIAAFGAAPICWPTCIKACPVGGVAFEGTLNCGPAPGCSVAVGVALGMGSTRSATG